MEQGPWASVQQPRPELVNPEGYKTPLGFKSRPRVSYFFRSSHHEQVSRRFSCLRPPGNGVPAGDLHGGRVRCQVRPLAAQRRDLLLCHSWPPLHRHQAGPFSIGSCRFLSGLTNGSMGSSKFLFDKLSDENKEVVRLISLMLVEQVKKMNQDLESPQMVLLKKVHDEQKDTTRALVAGLFVFCCVLVCVEKASYNVKIQSLQMVDNLASNSEEIVNDLVKAVVHGVSRPKIFGVGKPFVWQHKWLQEKKAEAVPEPGKTEDLKTGKKEEAPVEVEAASWLWWRNKGPQPPVQVEVEAVPEPAKKEDLKTGKEEEALSRWRWPSWLWWRNKGPQPPVKVEVEAVPEPGKEEDLKTGKKEDVEEDLKTGKKEDVEE